MIVGERGTGKERVARYIHHSGPRQQGAFIAVNCAGVPEALFEAEFFGSEKGAYTGAGVQRAGYLERAHGGTLFLDEVGMMPTSMQAKLLRVLQDRVYGRIGSSSESLLSNFQLISATNIDPYVLIASGKLREDFYDRIAAVSIQTPTLRQCLADIPLLAETTLQRLTGDKKHFSRETLDRLATYKWPGNVRELQRVIQEAVVRSEDERIITPEHLPDKIQNSKAPVLSIPQVTPNWSQDRILAELRVAVEAKRIICSYKGEHWKAEFMRKVYPHCKAQNAKGFSDLIKRLTQGPWGDPNLHNYTETKNLLSELENRHGH
jgi:transcriptional regulator with PAS, ATPase and Fis domain